MSKARILWLEDDAYIVGDIVYPLKKMDISIDIVESLDQFVKMKASFFQYDLIILDLVIPNGTSETYTYTGIEVLKIIRNDLKSLIPIIILSAVRAADILEEVKHYGVSAILCKPTRSAVLAKEVTSLLKQKLTN